MKRDFYKKKGKIFFFLFLFLLDITTKYLTVLYIPKMRWYHITYPYGGIGIFENLLGVSFSINYIENTGAAWGILSSYKGFLLFLRLSIVAGLFVYLFFNREKAREIPLLLILTGALGNVLDFFVYGHVVDMLHFNFWGWSFPIFNLADVMISIGIFWLFILLFFRRS